MRRVISRMRNSKNGRFQRELKVTYVFVAVFVMFMIASPKVFLSFNIYNAVLTSVPIIIVLTLSVVFSLPVERLASLSGQ